MSDRDDILEQLSAWLDGELSDEQARRVEKAVRDDPHLQGELEALRSVRRLVRALPGRKAPEGFAARVLARAERAHLLGQPSAMVSRSFRWISLATAAVVLLSAGVVLYMILYMVKPPPMHEMAARPANNKPEPPPPAVSLEATVRDHDNGARSDSPRPSRAEVGEKTIAPPAGRPAAKPAAPPVVAAPRSPKSVGDVVAGPPAPGGPERMKESEELAKAGTRDESSRTSPEVRRGAGGAGAAKPLGTGGEAPKAPVPAPSAPATTAKDAAPLPELAMKNKKLDAEWSDRRVFEKGGGEIRLGRVLLRTADLTDGRRSVEAVLARNGLTAVSDKYRTGKDSAGANVYYAVQDRKQVEIVAHLTPQQVSQVRGELDALRVAWARPGDRPAEQTLAVAGAASPVDDQALARASRSPATTRMAKMMIAQVQTAPAEVDRPGPPAAEAPAIEGKASGQIAGLTTRPAQKGFALKAGFPAKDASSGGMMPGIEPAAQSTQVLADRKQQIEVLERQNGAATQPTQPENSHMAQADQMRQVQQAAQIPAPYTTRPAVQLPGETLQVQPAGSTLQSLVITVVLREERPGSQAEMKAATTAPAALDARGKAEAAQQAAPDAAERK
ncbi:MAG: hypothetical protein BWX88_04290 [Planctomycetes bacterium ADurb.Bin126]|nr:MAG: hypothetical protein BWX88_04290 [Planctomycetes bacterium ADurb.Bin126]